MDAVVLAVDFGVAIDCGSGKGAPVAWLSVLIVTASAAGGSFDNLNMVDLPDFVLVVVLAVSETPCGLHVLIIGSVSALRCEVSTCAFESDGASDGALLGSALRTRVWSN